MIEITVHVPNFCPWWESVRCCSLQISFCCLHGRTRTPLPKKWKNRSFKQRQNWTMLYCWWLSTILSNIVEPESGVTMLNNTVYNYEQCGQNSIVFISFDLLNDISLSSTTSQRIPSAYWRKGQTQIAPTFFCLILGTKHFTIKHTESKQIGKDILLIREFFRSFRSR